MSETWYYVSQYGKPEFVEKVAERSTAAFLICQTPSGRERREAIESQYRTYRKTRTEALADYIARAERRVNIALRSLEKEQTQLAEARKMIP